MSVEGLQRRLEFIRDNLEPKTWDMDKFALSGRESTQIRTLGYTIQAAMVVTGQDAVIAIQDAEDLAAEVTEFCRKHGYHSEAHFAEVYRWLHDARHVAELAAYGRVS